ncbi:MAG: glycosyltransferase [Bacteroidota bacterium]
MILFLSILCLFYFLALIWVLTGMNKLGDKKIPRGQGRTQFSIIIPFRNEAGRLPALLSSLKGLEYPLTHFEVLFVDDESEDSSRQVIEEALENKDLSQLDALFDFRILRNRRLSNSPKKDAISLAVQHARHDWILTTDADCILPGTWLKQLDSFIETAQPKMVCAPVIYSGSQGLVQNFQFLDGLSLQAVTMGSFGWRQPLLSNGANMAYRKSTFLEVHGYAGNDHIASGDDIFLLEKVQNAFPEDLYYLNGIEAAVYTQPENTWKEVINQRVRWASKTSKQKRWGPKILGVVVLLGNLAFLIALYGLIVNLSEHRAYIAFLLQKLVMDLVVVTFAASYLKQPIPVAGYFINAFIYPFLTLWVVIRSLFGSYLWKGRKFRK